MLPQKLIKFSVWKKMGSGGVQVSSKSDFRTNVVRVHTYVPHEKVHSAFREFSKITHRRDAKFGLEFLFIF